MQKLVAIDEDADTDTMLGVARIIGDADGKTGEFAVLVGDMWQGEGIGSRLLGNCLKVAEKQGFKTVFGIAIQENRGMSALGRKLGFEIQHGSNAGEYKLTIQLGDNQTVSND